MPRLLSTAAEFLERLAIVRPPVARVTREIIVGLDVPPWISTDDLLQLVTIDHPALASELGAIASQLEASSPSPRWKEKPMPLPRPPRPSRPAAPKAPRLVPERTPLATPKPPVVVRQTKTQTGKPKSPGKKGPRSV
jgi:hypothetical protein